MPTKKAFITGASSGIGLATVQYLVEKGWEVAATLRRPDAVPELQQQPGVRIYALDVCDSQQVKEVVQQAWQDMGHIDVVINNAGYGAIGPFEAASEEEVARQMDTNYMGTVRVIQAFLPFLKAQQSGVIINLSSIAGRLGFPLYNIYNASKFAVEGLTESLYYELHPFNIAVRLVEPGPIKTEFNGRSKQEVVAPDHLGYEALTTKVLGFYNQMFQHAEEVDVVARTIYRAATRKGSRIRYPAGRNARLLLLLSKLTPGAWLRRISRAILLP